MKRFCFIHLGIPSMMNRKIFFFMLFQFVLFIKTSTATHIAGGEMNYRFLGGTTYEVTLTVYRDCYNGVPPFDNPASIGIFDQNNALIQELQQVLSLQLLVLFQML